MSRFLFVVPPLVGHINPAAAVAAELGARGHELAWACADPALVRRLADETATVFTCAGPLPGDWGGARPADIRGPEALKFLWERFLAPLAVEMAPAVEAAVTEFRPDVVVADQQALAGGLVAERLGVTWATSATTTAEFTDPLAGMPKVTGGWTGCSASCGPASATRRAARTRASPRIWCWRSAPPNSRGPEPGWATRSAGWARRSPHVRPLRTSPGTGWTRRAPRSW